MPWCPRCDETFPQGPACPRCSARLVQRERETPDDTLLAVPGLKNIKVSRRYERAFDRLSGPRQQSSRALALALVLLVFASGYLLGRVGSIGGPQPTVRALPAADPLTFDGVAGSVSYLVTSRDQVATVVQHRLEDGDVTPRARLSTPTAVSTGEHVATRLVAHGRSVAIVVEGGGQGTIAFVPADGKATTGLKGFDVAWLSNDALVVRQADSTVVRWKSDAGGLRSADIVDADALLQTPGGPVVKRGDTLESLRPTKRTLPIPRNARVVAVSGDTTRAVLDGDEPVLWDGKEAITIRADIDEVLGASFERTGEHAAVLINSGGDLLLAVVDARGNAALKPLPDGRGCAGTSPAWDANGRWIYLGADGGAMYAVEAHGGRVKRIRTHGVGCGVAWVDTA